MTRDIRNVIGVVADAYYNPETKVMAWQYLASRDVMAFDRVHTIKVHDFLFQRKENRVAVRSDDGRIYVLRPVTSGEASAFVAHYHLTEEEKTFMDYYLRAATEV